MLDVCVTHKFCLDGLASSWVFKKFKVNQPSMVFFSSARMEWESYGLPKIIERKSDLGTVFFIDMNPSITAMHELNSNGIEFEVLDHHEEEFYKTLKIATSNNINFKNTFDVKECGATLAWRRFFGQAELPAFLKYIKKNDIWEHATEEDSFAIEYIKANLPNNAGPHDVDEFVRSFDEAKAIELGRPLYQKTLVDVQRATRVLIVVDFDGTEVAVANESVNPSLVGHELARRAPRGLGMAFYINTEKSRVKAAVRGDGASTFCKKFGGGGHFKAAGFEMDLSEFSQYLKSARKIKEK